MMQSTQPFLRRATEIETSFVLRFFEDFYQKVLDYKNKILFHKGVTQQDGVASLGVEPQEVFDGLRTILERQAVEATRYGGAFAATTYAEAQYIMSALADEVFLNIDWDGHHFWEDHLLESWFFKTHEAGEALFGRIDHFLKERDVTQKDLGQLYLFAMGLGFLGKYRGRDDNGALAHYTHQLYLFIYHQEPDIGPDKRIFPAAYQSTLEGAPIKLMQDTRWWMLAIGIALSVVLVLSFVLWRSATHDVRTQVEQILEKTGSVH